MRPINRIIIHCTATPEGRDVTISDVRKWHIARGWRDVGYHFLIRLDGTVETGRPIEQAGAHVKGFNSDSIGIAYAGGCDAKP
jgi:N-acetylmuramoyl-L-alanine amidase